MKTFVAAIVVLAVAGPVSAADWSKTTSKDGNFEVLLPGSPKKMTRVLNTGVGKINLHMYIVPTQNNKVAFAVMYNDYPPIVTQSSKPDTILERALNGVPYAAAAEKSPRRRKLKSMAIPVRMLSSKGHPVIPN